MFSAGFVCALCVCLLEEEKLIKKKRREKREMRWEFNVYFGEYHYIVWCEGAEGDLMEEIDCPVDGGVLLQSSSKYADRKLNITNS